MLSMSRCMHDLCLHAERMDAGEVFDAASVIALASQRCADLIAGDELGVVHRDTKPENISLRSQARCCTATALLSLG